MSATSSKRLILLLLSALLLGRPASALELTFVGDVVFGEYGPRGYRRHAPDQYDPFAAVAELLRSDLIIANLETPLVDTLPAHSPVGTRYRFGASALQAEKLVRGGIGAVSIANNHANDLRGVGVVQTPQILCRLGIVPLGASGLAIDTLERGGQRLGFLSLTTLRNVAPRRGEPHLPVISMSHLAQTAVPLLQEARKRHDLLIVLLHWGHEYSDEPTGSQRRAAHALIDAGADLIVGHHPHVLQGIERYGPGAIVYSLGNFVFPNVAALPRLTGVLRLQAGELRFHPVLIGGKPRHPMPATLRMAAKVRERVQRLSLALGTELIEHGDDLVLPWPTHRGPILAKRIP